MGGVLSSFNLSMLSVVTSRGLLHNVLHYPV